jgi:hypothetical protein
MVGAATNFQLAMGHLQARGDYGLAYAAFAAADGDESVL